MGHLEGCASEPTSCIKNRAPINFVVKWMTPACMQQLEITQLWLKLRLQAPCVTQLICTVLLFIQLYIICYMLCTCTCTCTCVHVSCSWFACLFNIQGACLLWLQLSGATIWESAVYLENHMVNVAFTWLDRVLFFSCIHVHACKSASSTCNAWMVHRAHYTWHLTVGDLWVLHACS